LRERVSDNQIHTDKGSVMEEKRGTQLPKNY